MRILGIDPSSTRTGYALFEMGRLAEAGVITPRKTRDDAERRIDAMCEDLFAMIVEWAPRLVLIEMPCGKLHRGNQAAASSGLTIYATAAGELRRTAKFAAAQMAAHIDIAIVVQSISEREWTKGKPKAKRAVTVAQRHASYAAAAAAGDDGGMDAADAIGLCDWWLVQKTLGTVARRQVSEGDSQRRASGVSKRKGVA